MKTASYDLKGIFYYSHPGLPTEVKYGGDTMILAVNTGRKCDSEECEHMVDPTNPVQGHFAKVYHTSTCAPSSSAGPAPKLLPTVNATGNIDTYYDAIMGDSYADSRKIWEEISKRFTLGDPKTEKHWLFGSQETIPAPHFMWPLKEEISRNDRLVYVTRGDVADGQTNDESRRVSRVETLLVAKGLGIRGRK
jgi:hypothetical protein